MKILFATDLTEPRDVTDAVESLATRLEAELLVLHVMTLAPMSPLPIDPMTGFGDFAYAIYEPETQRNIEQAEKTEFDTFLLERFTCPLRPALQKGEPTQTILEDAEEWDVDLIILGKRHHGRIEKLFLGTVTGEIIEHSSRPVLLMPIKD